MSTLSPATTFAQLLLAQLLVALALRTRRAHVGPPALLLLLDEAAVEGNLELVALAEELGVRMLLMAVNERLNDILAPRVRLEERWMHLVQADLRHSPLAWRCMALHTHGRSSLDLG